MKQQTFEAMNDERWTRFLETLDSVERGYRLNENVNVDGFVDDYQSITHALALAKHRGYSRSLIGRLNDLVVRGHSIMYAHRSGFFVEFLRFVFRGFPQTVRREWAAVAIATLFFFAPLIAVSVKVVTNPDWVYSVMEPEQVSSLEAMYNPESDHFSRERPSDGDFQMFGYYIYNNIGISFRVFASGLLFGLGTIAQLVFNGVNIGAAFGHMSVLGFEETFHAFVIGHGAFELTAIVLSGAAGLLLGYALIAPGVLTRTAALRSAGSRAIRIVFGSTLMLIIAAFLEAFWSSSHTLPAVVKFAVGGLFWALVVAYFLFAGRRVGPD